MQSRPHPAHVKGGLESRRPPRTVPTPQAPVPGNLSQSIHDTSAGTVVVVTSMSALPTWLLSYVDESACSALQYRVPPQVYSNRLSEVVSGNAIKKLILPREELVILTKASLSIMMQPLHDVVKAGYVRYIGMSSCYAYQCTSSSSPSPPNTLSHPFFVPVIQMQNYAITHNLTPFISMQNHYSLMYREEEREMFPTLTMHGVGSIPWSPLARGLLSRPNAASSKRGDTDPILARYKTEANLQVVDRVEELAKKKGVKMAQVALAWIFAKPGVSAPIIGTTNLSNLEELLGALDIKLSEEEVKYLEEPYKPMVVVGAL
ncbi:hypothetical protein VTO73DRAFT_2379 [Trametes versicolor]